MFHKTNPRCQEKMFSKSSKSSNYLLFVSLTCLISPVFSQSNYFPLNRSVTSNYESILNNKKSALHTSVKPYLASEVNAYIDIDTASYHQSLILKRYYNREQQKQVNFEVFPLFSLQPGWNLSDTINRQVLASSVGLAIQGKLGNKLSFQAIINRDNSSYISYIDNYVSANHIIPGEGYAYGTDLGYHFRNNTGYLSYSPSTYFNFQLGQGKSFWGDGYRSLLLSDVAKDYSFFKITTNVWKIKYVNLFTNFKDIRNSDGVAGSYKDKYGSFHYLSWNATPWLNIGLFEAVIWQGEDTLLNRGYDINYLNPVIFYRPVEYSAGSADNSLMGLALKIKVAKKQLFYGQVILDEFLLNQVKAGRGWWANKQGFQLGLKFFDLFDINDLYLQAEFNFVRPYTYSHGSTIQNYAHFNQPLAHPLGANIEEGVLILSHRVKRLMIEGKTIVAMYGADTAGYNYGGNVYESYNNKQSEYGNYTLQGLRTSLLHCNLHFSYLIEPKTNLNLEVGYIYRHLSSEIEDNSTNFIYFGIRTALSNVYNDF